MRAILIAESCIKAKTREGAVYGQLYDKVKAEERIKAHRGDRLLGPQGAPR